MRRSLLAVALALLAAPALPPAAAQTAGTSPFVALYDDAFEANFGWTVADEDPASACSTGGVVPAGQPCWFRLADGVVNSLPRMAWFAARRDGSGAPDGYGNDADPASAADVVLTSREIQVPEGTSVRSLRVALKGSSQADADVLRLQWAPGAPDIANDWQTVGEWSGLELDQSYRLLELSSDKLRATQGAITVRFVFDADDTCDADPGTPGPAADPGSLPSVEPDPAGPSADPGDPTADPPVAPSVGGTPTADPGDPAGVASPGEGPDAVGCPRHSNLLQDGAPNPDAGTVITYSGWFIDHLQVVGRRDFVAQAGPSAPRIPVLAHATDPAAVNLIADMGKVVAFTLDESRTGGGPFSSMAVDLVRTGSSGADRLTVTLQQSGTTWSGLLAVNEPDLVAGTWQATFFGVTGSGARANAAVRQLSVEAQDAVPPAVAVAPAATGGIVRLGPGDDLMLTVQDPLLRRVTYAFPGLPTPLELGYPFLLPEPALPEGHSNLTIVATDRVGLSTTRTLHVDRDTVAPEMALNASSVVYAGVPFDLAFEILERSAHTLQVDVNGTAATFPFTSGQAANGRTTTLRVVPPGLGPLSVSAVVNDTMGNEARVARQFTAVPPVTDLRVASLLVESPATNTAREGQVIAATLQQVGGVAPLPVTVVFEASRNTYTTAATVPASGNLVVRWNATLPPGLHDVRVRIVPPAVLNETHPGNEELATPLEVFLGRVTVDGQVYAIRSDGRGLPTSVLVVGTSRTLPLDLVDSERGVAYRFTAANDRVVDWDPLDPVVALEDTPEPEENKDAPFPGLLMGLAAVALASLARRRR